MATEAVSRRLAPPPVAGSGLQRGLASALAWCGWSGGAAALYREVVREHPSDAVARFGLAEALARLGDWPAAAWAFREAARLLPGDPECLANLAVALARAGRWGRAAQAFRELARLRPGEAEPQLLVAESLRRAGRTVEAIRAFRAAAPLGEAPPGERSRLGPVAVGPSAWSALVAQHRSAGLIRRPARAAAALGGLWPGARPAGAARRGRRARRRASPRPRVR